jgi:hypothetical protein
MTDTKLRPEFKRDFIDFLKNGLGSCDTFISQISRCDTHKDLKSVLRDNVDEIASHLGQDPDDLEEENERLTRKVNNLEIEISELEGKMMPSNTVWDEDKLQAFIDYRDKYTPWEFEALLKNGKL